MNLLTLRLDIGGPKSRCSAQPIHPAVSLTTRLGNYLPVAGGGGGWWPKGFSITPESSLALCWEIKGSRRRRWSARSPAGVALAAAAELSGHSEWGGGARERQSGKPELSPREELSALPPLPSPPNCPHFERFTCKKRAKPGACVHVCQLRRPPRSLPPKQAAAATDRAMGPANSFPSNPALPPRANRRHDQRAPLPGHVTVTGAGSWGGPVGRLAGGRLSLWLPRLSRVLIVASRGCILPFIMSLTTTVTSFPLPPLILCKPVLPTLAGERQPRN